MDSERLDDLWSRWLAAELTPSEEGELIAVLSADDALRVRLLSDEQLDGMLRLKNIGSDIDAFVHSVEGRIRAERFASQFTRRVTDKVQKHVFDSRPPRKPLRWFIAAASAALLLVGLGIWIATRRPEPASQISHETPQAPKPRPTPRVPKQPVEQSSAPPDVIAPLFVAESGDDGNTGRDGAPLKNIAFAVAAAKPGQTILVADGSYAPFEIKEARGTAEKPIVIKAAGKAAEIKAEPNEIAAIQIVHSNYVHIEGLRSRGNAGKSLLVNNSHGVAVRRCSFGDNGRSGIEFNYCNDALIEDNDIENNPKVGISFNNSGDNVTIRNNRLRRNGTAIMLGADIAAGGADGVVGDGLITGVLIENNFISGTGHSSGMNLDGVQSAIIRNNVVTDTHATGIALYAESGAQGPKDVLVAHNTIDMSEDSRQALLFGRPISGIKVRNNIFVVRNPIKGAIALRKPRGEAAIDSDYNVFAEIQSFSLDDGDTRMTLAEWQARGHDAHSIATEARQLFVDPEKDFRLKDGSPAIGMGEVLTPAVPDLENHARPTDAAPDIGAYQSR